MPPGVRRTAFATLVTSLLALTATAVAYAGNGGFLPGDPHSPGAQRIQDAFLFVAVFTGVIFVVVEGALILFIVKYRRGKRPRTAEELHWWLDRSARALREGGKRFVPFVLRRKFFQRRLVEAACDYAAAELANAARDPEHPLRRVALGGVARFAERLASGDPDALAQAERLRRALVESLEAGPLVRDTLARLRAQLEQDLDDPHGALASLVDRQLHAGIVEMLDDPERRTAFDRWVRATAEDLLRRHHHQIGITVRENLEALETDELVARIEDRVGADLQFIRLNGAVVGGLVGVALAVARWLAG